ncbi:MAG: DEAD/DEAH box helicase [Pirellulales bacterium]|jgi:ATP-dependent RNA helicase DeaD|nr:DEAD/DEAH box helicase [Rhodopirellula sp.]MCH2370198.1 DEAD/DEAH box helicase [Pirellulales bacterium]|tara:strand:+ start:588 stop:1862 length:1275 start_codon:yes stop_codon:yes gene_type:complete
MNKPKKQEETTSDATQSEIGFADMDLTDEMMKSLERAGYELPSPVQAGVIPSALDGLDVMGQAQTGTGKTAAFAIPILEQLAPREEISSVQALVLVPTRELAVQVRNEFEKLAYFMDIKTAAIYGGHSIKKQIEELKRGVQVVVGTPGRVLDHIRRKTLDLRETWCVTLDEADRMLDIGFRPDIERILSSISRKDRQTLLLSATVPPAIERLAKRYMHDPTVLDFSKDAVSGDSIEQYYFSVDKAKKFELLQRLINRDEPEQAIIFCRTRRGTDKLAKKLKESFPNVGCIHGDMNQPVRDRVMKKFRDERLKVLVATDVVGRGIDVSTISHIINFDTPEDCDDYVHRIGRTGRMGKEGVAYTFVSEDDGELLTRIEVRINQLLEQVYMEGMELKREVKQDVNPERLAAVAAMRGRGPKKHRRRL